MKRGLLWLTACLGSALIVSGLHFTARAAAQASPSAAAAPAVDAAYLHLLRWRMVGPSRGGRVVAVAGDPVNKMTFYQGSTGGGVWKTDDGGLNWRNISDGFFHTGSVGAIAVAPSNPAIVYVGMGEACIRGNASYGDGVYKSIDGGKTWTHLGLDATKQIARVRINPTNPDLVYVAALGDPWGPSPDRGVYRSKDGGRTWEKVLFNSNDAGAIDLVMDPTNPDVMFASTLDLRRYPWGFKSAGPGTALYKTTDGGTTWKELTSNPGLPPGTKGRIGVAIAPSQPNRVWAIIDAEIGKKGVYRSDDGGATWKHLTDDADLTQRPWYYDHIFADPKNADVVWVLNVDFWKSTDGGEKFVQAPVPHGDNHDLWIDPADPQRMIEGNDGGATITFNGGRSWSTQLTSRPRSSITWPRTTRSRTASMPRSRTTRPSQFRAGPTSAASRFRNGRPSAAARDGYVAPSLNDPNVVYAADHHFLDRYDRRTHQTRDISPNPETHYGWGGADINYRFWWTYPVMVSPHDPKTLYVTSQFVHRTTNEGQSWETVSPDLTRHDPKTLEHTPSYSHPEPGEYRGPITREAYGPEWYATIFAFAESPAKAGLLWAGSDDGWVHVSQDNGKTWTKVTPPDLPEFALISIIDPSPHDPAVALCRRDTVQAAGQQAVSLQDGRLREDLDENHDRNPRRGLHARDPRGSSAPRPALRRNGDRRVRLVRRWRALAIVAAEPADRSGARLMIKDGDLLAATHGRSFWILDNVALLRQFDQPALTEPVHVFKPRSTVRFRQGGQLASGFDQAANSNAGQNPPNGVVIPFYVKDKPAEPVTVKIVHDKGGSTEEVRTLTLQPADAARFRCHGATDVAVPSACVATSDRARRREHVHLGHAVSGSRGPVGNGASGTRRRPARGAGQLSLRDDDRRARLLAAVHHREGPARHLQRRGSRTAALLPACRARQAVGDRRRRQGDPRDPERRRAEDRGGQEEGRQRAPHRGARESVEESKRQAVSARGAARPVPREGGRGLHQLPDRDRQQARAADGLRVTGRRAAHRGRAGIY